MKKFVDDEKICPHTASRQEIEQLLAVVERDLQDASVNSISADRRHATAYNAALQLATILLLASGYRAKSKVGHHWVTLTLIPEFMGRQKVPLARYLNSVREKRNMTDYDLAGHIAESEVMQLLKEVKRFKKEVLEWLKKGYPKLASRG